LENDKRRKILFSREEIEDRVQTLGKDISKAYEGRDLLVVSLLRGSFIFTADIVRELSIPVEVDFMTTSSYGHSEISGGNVEIVHDLKTDVKNRDVLIVDDIMDSGHTLQVVAQYLNKGNPNSIKTCVMLDKPSRRKVDIEPDFVGFDIPDVFIVGYGLNYGDYYRNIPYIFTFE